MIGEVPIRDNQPIKIEGFYAIYHEIDPLTDMKLRMCADVRETNADIIDRFECEPDVISIHTINGHILTDCYVNCLLPLNATILSKLRS